MNNFGKNLALWVIIGLLLIALFNLFQGPSARGPQTSLAFSDFLSEVQSGRVSDVLIQGDSISGHFQDGRSFTTYAPYDPNLVSRLTEHDVRISAQPLDESMPSLLGVLVSWFPMLLLIGVWVFFMRQMQSGGGKAMGFGKSRARLLTEKHGRVTFNDVAGIDEAKEELQEIVEFLKNPQKFQAVGGRIPKGVLLVGPPGTGKTLLARAIAGEANVPFFTISGSDFVEMFVGVGASRVRDMFEQAKKHAPCIVFIDEIDAVGRHRGAGLGGGNDEREQTLNQLLVEMDGFEANEGVILIAATNRPDVLDPALLRPGRFDRQVVVSNPDVLGREKILNVHIKKVRVGPDVDTRVIARGTPGFSGADLANIVNEAALLAARAGKRMVTMVDFEAAKDKVMMGAERRSMVMTEEEKRLTAYHESGHAILAYLMPSSDPIHKATIIPRGRALGLVQQLPERDQLSHTREMARRAGSPSPWRAGSPRSWCSAGARSPTAPPRTSSRRPYRPLHGHPVGHERPAGAGRLRREPAGGLPRPLDHADKNVSEATAQKIDDEIRRLIEEGHVMARQILVEHRHNLDLLAQALLEHETLNGEEIGAIMRGEPLTSVRRDEPAGTGSSAGKRSSVPTTSRPSGGEPPAGIEPSPQPGA